MGFTAAAVERAMAAKVPYGPDQIRKLLVPDLEYVAGQRAAWVERFTKEVATR
jgi:hypothetical protein